MPKQTIDYQRTIIYKIVCNDLDKTDVYVGYTSNFNKRKCLHKTACNNVNGEKYELKVYKYIRQNGGWENFSMVEIEKYPCNDSNEARARERHWYENLNSGLNCNRPITSDDEKREQQYKYRIENKDLINAKQKIYYERDKDKKKQYYERNKDRLKHNRIAKKNKIAEYTNECLENIPVAESI